MGRDTFHQTRLFKAPSSLALNTSTEGAATAPLGNLQMHKTVIAETTKNFFITWSPLNLSDEFRLLTPVF